MPLRNSGQWEFSLISVNDADLLKANLFCCCCCYFILFLFLSSYIMSKKLLCHFLKDGSSLFAMVLKLITKSRSFNVWLGERRQFFFFSSDPDSIAWHLCKIYQQLTFKAHEQDAATKYIYFFSGCSLHNSFNKVFSQKNRTDFMCHKVRFFIKLKKQVRQKLTAESSWFKQGC